MSDDMFNTDEDLGGAAEEAEGGKKIGFLSGTLIQILKFVGMAIGLILAVVTIVIVTIQIFYSSTQTQTVVPVSEAGDATQPIYSWYIDIGEIRGRTSDEVAHTVIVDIILGYELENEAVSKEISDRKPQLRDLIRNYFTRKTAGELTPENEDHLKDELLQKIAQYMGGRKVRAIIFDSFSVLPF